MSLAISSSNGEKELRKFLQYVIHCQIVWPNDLKLENKLYHEIDVARDQRWDPKYMYNLIRYTVPPFDFRVNFRGGSLSLSTATAYLEYNPKHPVWTVWE